MEIPTPPQSPVQQHEPNRKKRFSFKSLLDLLIDSIDRFPLTFLYVAAFAVWGVVDIWISHYFNEAPAEIQNLEPSLWFFTVNGILLTLAVSLWCEYTGKIKHHTRIQLGANILLFADFIYMVFNFKTMGDEAFIAHLAIETALVVAIIFVPALKRLSVRQSLMFSFIQFSNIIVSALIGLALGIAYIIIYYTIEILFGDIDFRIFSSIQFVFGLTLAITIFICRIPHLPETVRRAAGFRPTKFIVGLIKYLLLPLTAIYMLILYAYGADIIMQGHLPSGVICYMVTALTCAVFMVLFLLKSVDINDSDRLTAGVIRILPLALIPLLIMMSVAIGQRISQYGITVSRLYVVTFNIWAYAASIYLYFTRSKRIGIVAQSFAVVFLLTSIIPGANYTVMVQRYMRSHVFTILDNAGFGNDKLPLNHKQMEKLSETLDDETWHDLASKLKYLDSHDDHSLTSDIVDFDIKISSWSYDSLFDFDKVEAINIREIEFNKDNTVSIPTSFDNVKYYSEWRYDLKADESDMVDFALSDSCSIRLDIGNLKASDGCVHDPIKINIIEDSTAVFIPSSIEYRISDDDYETDKSISNMSVKGYLFTKTK
ncbi:MAG: DUF4153 domain-containing protein [Muribaculaceae bacterium]|nr:DUF4153 domain-containing protein [Muribaculaceae bacterium]